jgi:hypothetical protein
MSKDDKNVSNIFTNISINFDIGFDIYFELILSMRLKLSINFLRAVVAKNQAGQKVTFSDHQVS